MSESIVIVGAARTPMGAFQGDFSALSAHDLGGADDDDGFRHGLLLEKTDGSA
jgi:acetyl-CoA C-acetyltransferase